MKMQKGGGKHNPENGEGDARVVEPTPRAHTGTTGSTTFRDALEAPVEKETDGKWEPSEVGCASRHMPQLGSNLDFLHRCMPSPLPNTEGHTGTAPKTFVWEWDVQGNCALRVRPKPQHMRSHVECTGPSVPLWGYHKTKSRTNAEAVIRRCGGVEQANAISTADGDPAQYILQLRHSLPLDHHWEALVQRIHTTKCATTQ